MTPPFPVSAIVPNRAHPWRQCARDPQSEHKSRSQLEQDLVRTGVPGSETDQCGASNTTTKKLVGRCHLTVVSVQAIQCLLDRFQHPKYLVGEDTHAVSLYFGCNQAIGVWLDGCNASGVSTIAFTSAAEASKTRPTEALDKELAIAKLVQSTIMRWAHGVLWVCCSGLVQQSRLHAKFTAGDASLFLRSVPWMMLDQGLLRPIEEAITEILGVGLETLDLRAIDMVHHLDNSDWW